MSNSVSSIFVVTAVTPHLLKAFSSIRSEEESGKEIDLTLVHPKKASFPIFFKDSGRQRLIMFSHLIKASSFMTSRVSGSETSCSFKQSAKAPSPMVVTPNGITILLRL